MFLMIPEALREALGTQMVLSKYLLSGTMPHTEKAKKTLTQEFHVTQEADIQKKKITKQSGTKNGTVTGFPVKTGSYKFTLFPMLGKHPAKIRLQFLSY